MPIEREKLLKTRPTAPFSRIQRIRAQDDDTLVEFINGLFVAAVEAKDNGHWEQVQEYLEKWEELLANQRRSWMVFREEKVWAPLAKPLKVCRVALITTGGVYIEGEQERFRAEDPEGDWSFRAIPRDTPKAKLAVAHTHYDTSGSRQDINCVFPYERMVELEADGVIGEFAEVNYGFMGFIPKPQGLIDDTAPEVARRLKEAKVDAIIIGTT